MKDPDTRTPTAVQRVPCIQPLAMFRLSTSQNGKMEYMYGYLTTAEVHISQK
jgi:hypothetical protein